MQIFLFAVIQNNRREIKNYIYIKSLTNRYANPRWSSGQIKLYEGIANELDYKWDGILLQQDRRASPSVDILEIQSNFMLSAARKFPVGTSHFKVDYSRIRKHPTFRSDADRFWLSQFLNSLRRYCAALTSYFIIPAFSLREYSSREKKDHTLLRYNNTRMLKL